MKRSEERIKQAKWRIFEQIEALLDTNNMMDISFGKIAKRLGCQPNSVAYYFENKTDMLLQFVQEYTVTADTELLPALREGLEELPPVERFCREIDCIFAVSDRKSKPRLLNNFFLITNSPLRTEFNADLNKKVNQDVENNRQRLASYLPLGILCEERFQDAFTELAFYNIAFSMFQIFSTPRCTHPYLIHNTIERLKATFLKDSLYTPQYLPSSNLPDYPYEDIELALRRYRPDGSKLPDVKLAVFQTIRRLLAEDRIDDITFAKLAEYCYCYPSGIAYYFKNKQDLLLQFCIWEAEGSVVDDLTFSQQIQKFEPSLRMFCQIVASHCSYDAGTDRVKFWVNYFVVNNSASNSEYRDYFRFHLHRENERLCAIFGCFQKSGFLRDDTFSLSELCMFADGLTLAVLYQSPILNPERLSNITAQRMVRTLLKPEFHEKALQLLEEFLPQEYAW